ncbi:GNAT family N-acetyltransferase [Flammeovirgaceae bacterium SG7u.111]|nr:GNAT family N-acetyltransferase [Flammeovirgaceae bacterium SG7u.132]WPO33257.1 GNAT family N-acetyltransferase [Flammeovirgaceae bacterium SG7u.111]
MIRKYKESEIPTLLTIWEQASTLAHPFLESAFVEYVKTAMRDMYLPNSDTWVYEESGKILGFISMAGNEIGGLFVLPNHHSKGIGSKLVKHIRQFHEGLEVEVFRENKIGLPFYEKLGFETFKEYTMEETGQKVLRMKVIDLVVS